MTTDCLSCHRDARGAQLCGPCRIGLEIRLGELPEFYRQLEAELRPGARGDRGGRVAVVREAPLPVAEDVLTLRGPGGIVGVLEDWRTAMHHELGWDTPRSAGSIEDRVRAAADALRTNSLWIAEWQQAGDLAAEVRQQHAACQTILNPAPPGRSAGQCAATFGDGTLCGAPLWAPEGAAEIRCRACGVVYPPSMWLALATGQWADAA